MSHLSSFGAVSLYSGMAWVYLLAAGICEIVWAIGLKKSDGFTRPWTTAWTVLVMLLSFWLLSYAMKALPLGTAYAVWTGIGAVGTVLFGRRQGRAARHDAGGVHRDDCRGDRGFEGGFGDGELMCEAASLDMAMCSVIMGDWPDGFGPGLVGRWREIGARIGAWRFAGVVHGGGGSAGCDAGAGGG